MQVSPREKPAYSGWKIPSSEACWELLPPAEALSGLLRVFTAFLGLSYGKQGIMVGWINISLRGMLGGGGAKRHMLKKKKIFYNETHCNNGKNWLVLKGGGSRADDFFSCRLHRKACPCGKLCNAATGV